MIEEVAGLARSLGCILKLSYTLDALVQVGAGVSMANSTSTEKAD